MARRIFCLRLQQHKMLFFLELFYTIKHSEFQLVHLSSFIAGITETSNLDSRFPHPIMAVPIFAQLPEDFSPAGVLTSQGGWRGNLCHNTPRFHPQLSVVGGGIEICCFLTHITTRLKSPPPCRTPPTPLTPPPTPLLRSAAPPLLHYMILLL